MFPAHFLCIHQLARDKEIIAYNVNNPFKLVITRQKQSHRDRTNASPKVRKSGKLEKEKENILNTERRGKRKKRENMMGGKTERFQILFEAPVVSLLGCARLRSIKLPTALTTPHHSVKQNFPPSKTSMNRTSSPLTFQQAHPRYRAASKMPDNNLYMLPVRFSKLLCSGA